MSDFPGRATGAGSISAVVNSVLACVRAARALECALLFVAGGLAARSAALLSPAPERGAFALLLCGALCAAAWWLEHPHERGGTARALDRRLRYDGALETAFELEVRRPALAASAAWTPMEELVRARVLARLRLGEALRVSIPAPLLPFGAPVLMALLLLVVQDARRPPGSTETEPRALADGLERALGRTVAAESAELDGLLREVRELSSSPRPLPGGARAPESLRARLAALDRRLFELSARGEPGGESARRLEEARAWLDALATSLGERAGEVPAGTEPGSLTQADPDGTISRPLAAGGPGLPPSMTPSPVLDPGAPPGPAPDAALGVQAGNPWPAEYDGVVERWIERTRAARERERP